MKSIISHPKGNTWKPLEPDSLGEAGLTEGQLEHLILKSLNAIGDLSGREIATQHAIAFRIAQTVLADMKQAQLVGYRDSAAMNDYLYQLTDMGRKRARKLAEQCTYFGAAPVPLANYVASVATQSLTNQHPTRPDLERAFSDLLINHHMLRRLGPAVNSGRGLFLFGPLAMARRASPNASPRHSATASGFRGRIGIDGEIMRRLRSGQCTKKCPWMRPAGPLRKRMHRQALGADPPPHDRGRRRADHGRPGGDIRAPANNVSEAPLQLKSNCGTLVIDDFGRQRMTHRRTAQPLDRPAGKTIRLSATWPTARRSRCRSTS